MTALLRISLALVVLYGLCGCRVGVSSPERGHRDISSRSSRKGDPLPLPASWHRIPLVDHGGTVASAVSAVARINAPVARAFKAQLKRIGLSADMEVRWLRLGTYEARDVIGLALSSGLGKDRDIWWGVFFSLRPTISAFVYGRWHSAAVEDE